ncbi:MAG: glycosyltransferase family 4 protein [Patescibacteria group bacterium]
MAKLKVAYITNLYWPYEIGGAEMYVRKLIGQIRAEVDPFIITTTKFRFRNVLRPTVETTDNVRVYRFYPINICSPHTLRKLPAFLKPVWHIIDLWNIHAYCMVKSILKKEKPDVVHSHNIAGFSTSIFKAARSCSMKSVHTLHDYQLISPWAILFRGGKIIKHFNFFEKIFQSIKRSTSRRIDVVTAPSEFVLKCHSQLGYFHGSKLLTVRLGVGFAGAPEKRERRSEFTVLYIGQLVEHKGVDVLVRAFKNIKGDDCRLVIAGTGPTESYLRRLALGDSRISLTGFISGVQKAELFKAASVAVVPSVWYDNSPVAIYESFGYGVPVVGSDIGGIPELIVDNVNGLTVNPGDTDDLERALRKLHDDPVLRIKLSANASASLRQYSFVNHVSELLKLYRE